MKIFVHVASTHLLYTKNFTNLCLSKSQQFFHFPSLTPHLHSVFQVFLYFILFIFYFVRIQIGLIQMVCHYKYTTFHSVNHHLPSLELINLYTHNIFFVHRLLEMKILIFSLFLVSLLLSSSFLVDAIDVASPPAAAPGTLPCIHPYIYRENYDLLLIVCSFL